VVADERLHSIELTTELARRAHAKADDLRRAIEAFEPLSYRAGEQAAVWLKECLDAGHVPAETQLLFGDDASFLLGFYVVRPLAFHVRSRDDRAKLAVRLLSAGKKVQDDPQPGSLIELIARNRRTPRGFGETLIDHVVASTIEKGSVAVLIEPDNLRTDALFRDRRYGFRTFDAPAVPGKGLEMLWLPVHEAVAQWP
jgi:hypothetical protein